MFFDKKLSNSSEFYYLKPGPYPSLTDIVEAMNTLIQEAHNQSENCITVKVCRRTQKVEIYLANENLALKSLVPIWDKVLEISGSNVGKEIGAMLRGN